MMSRKKKVCVESFFLGTSENDADILSKHWHTVQYISLFEENQL